MAVFTFSGKDASGQKVSGERNAPNKQMLATQLRREQITAGSIREKGKEFSMPTFGTSKVRTKDIAIFFRQFSVMIDAGLPLVQCLEILAANQENMTFQKTLNGVRTTVEGGATLANAMRQFPKVFDDLTTNMMEAGETGGILDIILQRLAAYVEKAVKLRVGGEVGLDLPDRGRQSSLIDRRRLAEVGGSHLCQPLCRPGRSASTAHPYCHWAEPLRRPVLVVLSSRWRGPGGRDQANPKRSQGPLLPRLCDAENAHRRDIAAQDRRGTLYPNPRYADYFGRADSGRL